MRSKINHWAQDLSLQLCAKIAYLGIIGALLTPTMTEEPRFSIRFSEYHFAGGSFAEQCR
jgi:hypothetical protein